MNSDKHVLLSQADDDAAQRCCLELKMMDTDPKTDLRQYDSSKGSATQQEACGSKPVDFSAAI